jgi:ATP-dependent DNA helicase RecG
VTAAAARSQNDEPDDGSPPVQFLKGVGPKRAKLLEKLGVRSAFDLLQLVPRRHEDRRVITAVEDLRPDVIATVRGRVASVRFSRMRRRMSVVRVKVADETGAVEAEWWNQPFRKEHFNEGDELVLSGKVVKRRGLRMVSPETEVVARADALPGATVPEESLDWGRLVPVYPLTRGLTQPPLRRAVHAALDACGATVEDSVPPRMLEELGLPALRDAVADLHFPESPEAAAVARRRMRFDELLFLQLALALRRRDLVREERGFRYAMAERLDDRIRRRFPWPLTDDQDRAVDDITKDLLAEHPMNRLLQGDVGCGKTAVALYAMLAVVAHGRQAALLAPTEILAEQHLGRFREFLDGSRVRVAILGGGMAAKKRTSLLAKVVQGDIDLLVGTHALLEQDVKFKDLGLAVVDEQHRFGVHQRKVFRDKGLRPDLLYLTATPIPRTLCMTLFGDLDVSVIQERPPGRHPVVTKWVRPRGESSAHEFVRREVAEGRQAYVICPLVEESEDLDLRAAVDEAARLESDVFPELRVGLLHGRMARDEKQRVMESFRAGDIDVLVSTVVVEVGVDVPNATVLMVLHAERFGLSQLHQLRGRIGRGEHVSTCLLFAESKTPESKARLEAMVATDDGFRIAEEDLRIRGPGEFFGTRQSGLPDLRVPDALTDTPLLDRARREAFDLVEVDPDLSLPEHADLRRALLRRFGDRLALARV